MRHERPCCNGKSVHHRFFLIDGAYHPLQHSCVVKADHLPTSLPTVFGIAFGCWPSGKPLVATLPSGAAFQAKVPLNTTCATDASRQLAMPRKAAEGQAGGSGGSARLGTSAQADDPSDSEHMQDGNKEPVEQRDVLAGTQTASALQALADAIAEPSAFLQPSAQIADVARQAAKVRGPRIAVGMWTSAQCLRKIEQTACVPHQHSFRYASSTYMMGAPLIGLPFTAGALRLLICKRHLASCGGIC